MGPAKPFAPYYGLFVTFLTVGKFYWSHVKRSHASKTARNIWDKLSWCIQCSLTQNSAFLGHPWTVGKFLEKFPRYFPCLFAWENTFFDLCRLHLDDFRPWEQFFCVYFKISGNFPTVQNRGKFCDFKYYICITVWEEVICHFLALITWYRPRGSDFLRFF